METTRLFGRGIANHRAAMAAAHRRHLIKTSAGAALGEEGRRGGRAGARHALRHRGLQRRVNFGRVDPQGAREIFIREAWWATSDRDWASCLHRPNRQASPRCEELEHKSRRQDVLVDDELIFAFYDQQLPADVATAAAEHWYRQASKADDPLLLSSAGRTDAPRAAGVTSEAFPKIVRLGGVDCAARATCTSRATRATASPSPCRCLRSTRSARSAANGWCPACWDKIQALLKSLPSPAPPRAAAGLCGRVHRRSTPSANAAGWTRCCKQVREDAARRAAQRLQADMLPPHLFMNFRVVDEHGRQLGQGRNLAALKAELGGQGAAFQALAAPSCRRRRSACASRRGEKGL